LFVTATFVLRFLIGRAACDICLLIGLKVDELVKDLQERLKHHNIITPSRVNQRQPDTTMSQNELILQVISPFSHNQRVILITWY